MRKKVKDGLCEAISYMQNYIYLHAFLLAMKNIKIRIGSNYIKCCVYIIGVDLDLASDFSELVKGSIKSIFNYQALYTFITIDFTLINKSFDL